MEITTANAAQLLIDGEVEPNHLLNTVEDHLTHYLPETVPGEKEMRTARFLRNIVLMPLVMETALSSLRQVKASGFTEITNEPVNEETEENWARMEFDDNDRVYLRSMYHFFFKHFALTKERMEARQPAVVEAWHTRGKQVFEATQAYLDYFRAKENVSRKGEHDIGNLGPTPTTGPDQLKVTYGTTLLQTLAVMAITQRSAGNTLSGPELAADLRNNLDHAAGLSGGKRNVVTNVLCSPHDYHDYDVYADMRNEDNFFMLGSFARRPHPARPGHCVAYPSLRPAPDELQQENLAAIDWMRAMTNRGDAAFSSKELRPAEAIFFIGSLAAESVWDNAVPFV